MTPAPTICPPPGFTIFVDLDEIRDGDTIVVRLRGSSFKWAVRLLDCWCPEVRSGPEESRKVGRAAMAYVKQVIEAADPGDLRLFVPWPARGVKDEDGFNILTKMLTFDRLLGFIYVGSTQTINRMLVKQGLASTIKGGKLGQ